MLERIPKTYSILQHTIMRKIMQQKIYIFIKCFYYSERAVPWRSFHEICLFLTMHHFYKVTSLSAENFFCKKESSSEMQSSVFTGRLDICWFWIAMFFTYAYHSAVTVFPWQENTQRLNLSGFLREKSERDGSAAKKTEEASSLWGYNESF